MTRTSEIDVWDQDLPGSGPGSTFVRRTDLKQVVKAKAVRDDWDDDDDDDDEQDRDVGAEKGYDGNAKMNGTKNDGTAPDPRLLGTSLEGEVEEDSGKIWEEANRRGPMPELVVASASTSHSFSPPPPAAFQPALRILKRSSPNTSAHSVGTISPAPLTLSSSGSSPGGTSPVPRGTLAEREAQYQEARSRIFGEKDKSGSGSGQANSGSLSRTSSSSGGVVIIRDPLGPMSEPEPEPGVGGQDKARGPGRPAKGFGERRKGKK